MARKRKRTKSSRVPTKVTAGLNLLASIVEGKSITTLREVDPLLLLDPAERSEEQQVYGFITRHHGEHQVIPTFKVIEENTGIVLPNTDEPIGYYFSRVRHRAMVRNIRDPYNRLAEALQSPRTAIGDMQEAIEELHQTKMRYMNAGSGIETTASVIDAVRHSYQLARSNLGMITGIPTGWSELDVVLNGYNKDDLVVWVARPGRGKSWMLLKQCHAAWIAGYKPLYISMEMGAEQNMRRLIGIESRINPNLIKRGMVSTLAEPNMHAAMARLLDLRPMDMVTANFSRTVDQIANFVDEHNPDIIYIDAGYLLSPRKKRYGSGGRRETISDVIEEIKELGANVGKPIVMTVQFNRTAEQRRRGAGAHGDGAPTFVNPIAHLGLDTIGETDVIGQTATHVLGLDLPPHPLPQTAYRVFGFLKGREGEDGWYLSRYPATRTAPIDLSLVSPSEPAYQAIINPVAQARRTPPNQRSNMMRIQQA